MEPPISKQGVCYRFPKNDPYRKEFDKIIQKAYMELSDKIEEQLFEYPEEVIQAWVDQGYFIDYSQEVKDGKIVFTASLRKKDDK